MIENSDRTGLFGGAFDPVHVGHMSVVESILNSQLVDEILLLPTPHPPHKQNEGQISFTHRYRMLELAFNDFEQVEVSDLEKKLPAPSYTLQTIKYLQEHDLEKKYFLCLGEDNLASFREWHKFREILNRVSLIVAARPGVGHEQQDDEILENAIFIDHSEMDISSTELRETKDENFIKDSVPGNVFDYIKRHNLYSL